MSNNADLIYKYCEKEVDSFNKSIDVLTGKLTVVLGFGGVLMKFAGDLPFSYFKLAISGLIAVAIIAAFVGLFPQDRGQVIRARAFVGDDDGWWFSSSIEEFQFRIVRQWVEHISMLERLLDFRAFWFKIALASLSVSALLFAVAR